MAQPRNADRKVETGEGSSDAATIRHANVEDADACLGIYGPFVEHTTVSFETDLPSQAAMVERIQASQRRHAWLVAEVDSVIVGYASAKPWDVRQAYDWTCETGIYLAPAAHRQGLGRRLYSALLDDLSARGMRVAMARVVVPHDASMRLHAALGFTQVGLLPKVGWKNNEWLDVALLHRTLIDSNDPPHPVTRPMS